MTIDPFSTRFKCPLCGAVSIGPAEYERTNGPAGVGYPFTCESLCNPAGGGGCFANLSMTFLAPERAPLVFAQASPMAKGASRLENEKAWLALFFERAAVLAADPTELPDGVTVAEVAA